MDCNSSVGGFASGIGGAISGDIVDGVHQGMRGLTGLGKVAIYDGTNAYKTIDMGTTNMYYDITALMNKVVTITNEGAPSISLSNVKITHKYAPVVTGKMGELFTMDTEAANIALNVFAAEQLADSVLTPKYPALQHASYCQNSSADVADLANAAAVYGCTAQEFFGA